MPWMGQQRMPLRAGAIPIGEMDRAGPQVRRGLTEVEGNGALAVLSNPISAIWDAIRGFCAPVPATEQADGTVMPDPYEYGGGGVGGGGFGGGFSGGGGGAGGGMSGMMDMMDMMEMPPPADAVPCSPEALEAARGALTRAVMACDGTQVAAITATADTCRRTAPTPELKRGWAAIYAEGRRQATLIMRMRCTPAGGMMGGGGGMTGMMPGDRPIGAPPPITPPSAIGPPTPTPTPAPYPMPTPIPIPDTDKDMGGGFVGIQPIGDTNPPIPPPGGGMMGGMMDMMMMPPPPPPPPAPPRCTLQLGAVGGQINAAAAGCNLMRLRQIAVDCRYCATQDTRNRVRWLALAAQAESQLARQMRSARCRGAMRTNTATSLSRPGMGDVMSMTELGMGVSSNPIDGLLDPQNLVRY